MMTKDEIREIKAEVADVENAIHRVMKDVEAKASKLAIPMGCRLNTVTHEERMDLLAFQNLIETAATFLYKDRNAWARAKALSDRVNQVHLYGCSDAESRTPPKWEDVFHK